MATITNDYDYLDQLDNGSVYDSKQSKFSAAFPWAVGTLTVAAGSIYAMTLAGPAIKVAGIAGSLFGGYAFFGVILTALSAKNAKEFSANITKTLTTSAAAVVTDIISSIAHAVLRNMIDKHFKK